MSSVNQMVDVRSAGLVGQPFGFFLINKPKGIVSFEVVTRLRKILQMKRIGYAGTLDPLASGLMLVAVGEATKILNDLEGMDKVYDVTIQFGATSETYDAEGPIHEFKNLDLQNSSGSARWPTRAEIEKIIQTDFSGERQQIPPKYSAVKIAGKRAYDLVRAGKEVTIPAKKVVFHDIKILSYDYPLLQCSVHCGVGTFIRTFAHDLGEKLGCGGYVQELRRTKIGEYKIENSVDLDKITPQNINAFLLSPPEFLTDWRQVEISAEEYRQLSLGAFMPNRMQLDGGQTLAMFEGKNVGLLEPCEGGRLMKFAKKFNLS